MMQTRFHWLLIGLLAVALSGCVSPGDVDPTQVLRYQQRMVETGPASREASDGLDLLKPDNAFGPDLLIERIVPRRVLMETYVEYEPLGLVDRGGVELRQLKVTTTITKTQTLYEPDDTGTVLDERKTVETKTAVYETLPSSTVPEPVESVREYWGRAGEQTWHESTLENAEFMINLSLDEAIMLALANSQDIRVASYDPAISRQEMIQAASRFDYVVFGGYNRVISDEQTVSDIQSTEADTRAFEVGMRNRTITGAEWELTWNLTRLWDNNQFSRVRTRWEPSWNLEMTQPLLRDAWPEFNLASLRIARLSHKASLAEFRRTTEELVTTAITSYWQLVQTREDLMIQKALLDRTIETLDRVIARRDLDATDVEVKQTAAARASRRAAVIRASKIIKDVEDNLARLLADERINILNNYEIYPTTEPSTAPAIIDQNDQLLTALRHNPSLEQARLAIDVAGLNVLIAENQALPRLDLVGSITPQGTDAALHEAQENLYTLNYLSYSYGITFEYPLGNRERLAEVKRRQLQKLRASAEMVNLADQIALSVRERIRQAFTTAEEMKARAIEVEAAKAENQALRVLLETRRMSPDLLNLEIQSQSSVAASQRAEVAAIVDYNISLAELARATGTVFEMHGVQLAMPTLLDMDYSALWEDWPLEYDPADDTDASYGYYHEQVRRDAPASIVEPTDGIEPQLPGEPVGDIEVIEPGPEDSPSTLPEGVPPMPAEPREDMELGLPEVRDPVPPITPEFIEPQPYRPDAAE